MPKRKVAQTVVVFREGSRITPAIGTIFDFTQDEVNQITSLSPEALTRPVIEVDVENLAAQEKAKAEAEAAAKAEADAAAAAEAAKAKAEAGKGKGKNKSDEDEV